MDLLQIHCLDQYVTPMWQTPPWLRFNIFADAATWRSGECWRYTNCRFIDNVNSCVDSRRGMLWIAVGHVFVHTAGASRQPEFLLHRLAHTRLVRRQYSLAMLHEWEWRQIHTSSVQRLPAFTAARASSSTPQQTYEGWNFNSGNYLFTTDTK